MERTELTSEQRAWAERVEPLWQRARASLAGQGYARTVTASAPYRLPLRYEDYRLLPEDGPLGADRL